jgi:hypothetical protein
MADDTPHDPNATALLIQEKRDKLLALRTELREQRESLLARIRRVDRELADCRATARFFGLKIEFPEESNDSAERELMYVRRWREQEMAAQRNLFNAPRHPPSGTGRPSPPPPLPPPPQAPTPPPPVLPAPPPIYSPTVTAGPLPRPTVREVALMRLRAAGDKGAKAAEIRDYFERTYGEVVHEKTVGMTLYRLLKANLVRRDGHTWFFGPPSVETKNPGGGTPGQNNIFE